MFFRVLKKDICKKKIMNLIILVFVIMAAMFLASSMKNLDIAFHGINEYLNMAGMTDYTLICTDEKEAARVEDYLKQSHYVTDSETLNMCALGSNNIKIKDADGKEFKFKYSSTFFAATQPQKYLKLLDDNGDSVAVKEGEIYFDYYMASKYGFQVGDLVTITVGDATLNLTLKGILKDALMGTSFLSVKRVLISEKDYNYLKEKGSSFETHFFATNTTNLSDFKKDLNTQQLSIDNSLDRSMIQLSYMLEMMVMAVLVIVSICLILISMLVLRFTIVFTIQDDYRQIGIMKALGLRNKGIKALYIVKYMAITSVGGLIGLLLSIPFGDAMTKSVVSCIVIKNTGASFLINLITVVIMVLFIIGYCYHCTRKVDHYSAIEAIRNGSESESFQRKSKMRLTRRKRMQPAWFMAVNDIVSHKRRYVVLLITFLIGCNVMIHSVSIMNTIKDDRMYSMCTGCAVSDVYISESEEIEFFKACVSKGKRSIIEDKIKVLEQDFAAKGVKTDIYYECYFNYNMYGIDKKEAETIGVIQATGSDDRNYEVFKGTAIENENEVIITKVVADKLGIGIGDNLYIELPEGTKTLVVVGLYRAMTNMGRQIRVSSKLDLNYQDITGTYCQGNFSDDADPDEQIAVLKKAFPDVKFKNTKDSINDILGNMMASLDKVNHFIILLVLGVNALVTVLMMKSFLTKDTGEIAMLKSLGFRDTFW